MNRVGGGGRPGPSNVGQRQVNVDISQLEQVVCSECLHERFRSEYMLRFLPRLLSPKQFAIWVTVPVNVCTNCGFVIGSAEEWESGRAEREGAIVERDLGSVPDLGGPDGECGPA
jgi:hypothetical protein